MQGKKYWNPAGLVLAFALGLLLSLPGTAVAGEADKPFGVALSITGDAASTMTVTWRCAEGKDAVLQVVSQEEYKKSGFTGAAVSAAIKKDISAAKNGAWHFQATAEGLKAGTDYVYRVGRDGAWSDAKEFTTEDPRSESLAFYYFGDIQPDRNRAEEYALWGKLTENALKQNPEAAFGILGGDIVNSGISMEQFDLFRQNAEPVFSRIPLMAANGNHESNFPDTGKPELYLDVFALPENGPENFSEEFYSFDYGPCHVLVLNSWIFSGEQKMKDADFERVSDWIRGDLAGAGDAKWTVAVTHVPVYAVCSDETADRMRAAWEPIFESYGVDLVLEGHQHVYSRSYPMYKGKTDHENGIPYIMGVSGRKFYSSADETFAEKTIYGVPNYQLIRMNGDSASVQTLNENGEEMDFVTLKQRKTGLTRGEYVKALWKGSGSPSAGNSPFSDTSEPWASWGYESGLIRGYGNGMFGAEDRITEEQITWILDRMGEGK